MTKARIFLGLSWFAFAVGLTAVLVASLPGGGRWMGWFMFDHGLVILIVLVASWTLRRPRPSVPPFRWPGARRVFAPWLIAAACVAVITLWGLRDLMPVETLLPLGHPMRGVGGRIVDATNAGEDATQRSFGLFAHAWVWFAFVGLCLWHVISIRDAQAREPSDLATAGVSASMSLRERADAEERLAPWRRIAIGAIWALALVWSVVAMWLFPAREMCAAPFPWQFALVPPIFFTLSGLFTKRAPYHVPWLAEIVDSRFGAGAYLRFLVSLKPMLLVAVSAGCCSLSVRYACAADGVESSFMPLFFASGGLGFVLLYGVLRLRKIEGA